MAAAATGVACGRSAGVSGLGSAGASCSSTSSSWRRLSSMMPMTPKTGRRRMAGVRMQQGRREEEASGEGGDSSTESLFMKELKRRGMKSVRAVETEEPQSERIDPPPPVAQNATQLERSRKLNSEGLEGLIPRATELVKLGGSFWVAFWPYLAATAAGFVAIYLAFGSGFVHGGAPAVGPPRYIDPDELLYERVAPGNGPDRVPFRQQY
eukprot:jgi/Chlat1/4933/Chrsp31S04850